jgi:hypothetical protein
MTGSPKQAWKTASGRVTSKWGERSDGTNR